MSTCSGPHVPQAASAPFLVCLIMGTVKVKQTKWRKTTKYQFHRLIGLKAAKSFVYERRRESRVYFHLELNLLSARIISGFCLFFDICRPCFLLLITSSFPPTHSNTKTRYQIKAWGGKKIKTHIWKYLVHQTVFMPYLMSGIVPFQAQRSMECRLHMFRFWGKRALLGCLHLKT